MTATKAERKLKTFQAHCQRDVVIFFILVSEESGGFGTCAKLLECTCIGERSEQFSEASANQIELLQNLQVELLRSNKVMIFS